MEGLEYHKELFLIKKSVNTYCQIVADSHPDSQIDSTKTF